MAGNLPKSLREELRRMANLECTSVSKLTVRLLWYGLERLKKERAANFHKLLKKRNKRRRV